MWTTHRLKQSASIAVIVLVDEGLPVIQLHCDKSVETSLLSRHMLKTRSVLNIAGKIMQSISYAGLR